ncbi:MAG TPA: L-threonylcarbamoyladenylate synthase [Fimbriimonadaceae bacterium]|nr:L-threonylcarbamoyladenylate synthase [Fimbriimonadaceae bacterium]
MITVKPDPTGIEAAARALRSGELVVMPTETVYGLACAATRIEAVERVFAAKGRPPENPLIVHGSDWTLLREAVAILDPDTESTAGVLAVRFWPGPLTLVLPKSAWVPDIVTAGMPTVAVRVPGHEAARALIDAAGVLVAAPSANRFMGLSPTRIEDIDPRIAAAATILIDAGPCEVGIESTVLDLTAATPRLLRPGGVSQSDLELALGRPIEVPDPHDHGARVAPGQYLRHYAPRTPLILVDDIGDRPGLTFGDARYGQLAMPQDPVAYAARLYAALAELDRAGYEVISVERPPHEPAWAAVWDRLRKAAYDTGRLSP